MAAASEHDIAFSMMRLWGREANSLACKYASKHETLNDAKEAAKWYSVQRVVAEWNLGEARLRSGLWHPSP
jgi:hypothetical protein